MGSTHLLRLSICNFIQCVFENQTRSDHNFTFLYSISYSSCTFPTLSPIFQVLFQATYWTNFVDRSTILPIAKRVYPEYDFETEPGLLTGITNLFSVSATYAILHMTLPITPVYITIFILRRSITKTLTKSHSIMSKETKAVHAQLLKVSHL